MPEALFTVLPEDQTDFTVQRTTATKEWGGGGDSLLQGRHTS